MEESFVSKKSLIISIMLAIFVILFFILKICFDDRTTVVFCNVGQGDAAYIRIKNTIDILIDAGPDRKVLDCLGRYMPFWDRKVELIFVSHNQKDHFGGIDFILDRYKIDAIYLVNDLNSSLQSFRQLREKIINKKIRIEIELAGKTVKFMNDKINILWPNKGLNSNNDNDFSSILLFNENNFKILFTGDASSFILSRLSHGYIEKVNILKVPHHGSKNGLNTIFLELADPNLAVISVGKNNSYGHPSN